MSGVIAASIIGVSTIAAAGISAYSSYKAAETQADAAQAGIDVTTDSFDKMQALLKPYVEAGTGALTAQQNLIGLGEPGAQESAIRGISEGPEMAALTAQGEQGILRNAGLTGGLRGGNTQAALAQFRPQLLSSLINQQYQRLGGLTQIGQASAAGTGAAGMQSGANIADLLAQMGQAQAGGQIGMGQAAAQPFNAMTQLATLYGLNKAGVF